MVGPDREEEGRFQVVPGLSAHRERYIDGCKKDLTSRGQRIEIEKEQVEDRVRQERVQ